MPAKIRIPALRPGTIARTALVEGLRHEAVDVVCLVARAGFGKTTVLAQWARADERPVVWISLDPRDNDPHVFLSHVVAALDAHEPVDPTLLAWVTDGKPQRASFSDRVARTLASRGPMLLVFDNADVLRAPVARRALSLLMTRVPPGSTAAVASRSALRLAFDAGRTVRELGPAELRLSPHESALVLESAGPDLEHQAKEALVSVCEGWPAALYLATLSRRDGDGPAGFDGSDRFLADYIHAEYLAGLRPAEIRFLRCTAILDELQGSLCDAVLDKSGCDVVLRRFARTGLVEPVEGNPEWYRLPTLLRELELRDLNDSEPQLAATLHTRAAAWYERAGDAETALAHARAAGDDDRCAAIVSRIAMRVSNGQLAEVEQAIAHLAERRLLHRYPAVALHGSRIHAFRGRVEEAESWLEVAQRGARGRDVAAMRPRLAVVRAALCRTGPKRMLNDARAALGELDNAGPWYPTGLLMEGTAESMLGSFDEAQALLARAAQEAAASGLTEIEMIATSQLAVLARADGDPARADALAAEAQRLAESDDLDGCPTSAIALATAARSALAHGRFGEGRDLVTAAGAHLAHVTEALPWLAVLTRLELAACCITLRDLESARKLLAETEAILALRPRLGTLVEQERRLAHDVERLTPPAETPAGLTTAELRLLPLLATHLSFREIADELHVSRNTVKTQAISIYRKLGVKGRSEAIAAVAALGQ